MFGMLDVSASALVAQRTRIEVAQANLANKDAIYDAQGNYSPYRRRVAILAPGDPATGSEQGVHVMKIDYDQSPFRKVYDPGHPNADAQGYVNYPNIESTMETVNALDAMRAYEANITAAESTKMMIQSSLRLLA